MELKNGTSILIFILASISCFPQTDIDTQKINSLLDGVISRYVDKKEFMGSVLVAKDDKIVFRKGYGYSDLENKIPNKPENIFCIASITKLFTLSSIHILSEKGLLDFNDPLSKYIPAYPNGDKILIKHLTSNTSGIVDYINELHYTVTDENVAIDSLIGIFEDSPQNFEPGEMYSYCNSGWVLLAYIIEKVSGLSYAEFVNENIFRKAAMNSTYSDWDYFSIKMAKGYHKENGAFVQNAYFSPSQIIGSGNIITTIDDLYKWYTSIYKSEPNCLKFQFRFNGCFGGFRATLFINRIFNSVYIILGNYDLAPLDEIVNELDKTLMESQTNCLAENSFEKYTGYYYAGDSYYIIIDKWKDKLVFHAGSMNQPVDHDTIYSLSDNHFLCTNVFFDFKDLDSIHYNKFNVTWGCNTYSYKRTNYHFNKEGANKYVGKFILDDNRKLEISFNENDCLEVLLEDPNKMINRYTAKGTTTTNFVFSFGRLIYDSLDNSRYQSIKINIDGISFTGKRTE